MIGKLIYICSRDTLGSYGEQSLSFFALNRLLKDERFAGKPGEKHIAIVLPNARLCRKWIRMVCETAYFKRRAIKVDEESVKYLGNTLMFLPVGNKQVRGISVDAIVTCFVDEDFETIEKAPDSIPIYRFVTSEIPFWKTEEKQKQFEETYYSEPKNVIPPRDDCVNVSE